MDPPSALQGIAMNKSKLGNKEAKKPRKVPDTTRPPAGTTPGALAVASLRKKKW